MNYGKRTPVWLKKNQTP